MNWIPGSQLDCCPVLVACCKRVNQLTGILSLIPSLKHVLIKKIYKDWCCCMAGKVTSCSAKFVLALICVLGPPILLQIPADGLEVVTLVGGQGEALGFPLWPPVD